MAMYDISWIFVHQLVHGWVRVATESLGRCVFSWCIDCFNMSLRQVLKLNPHSMQSHATSIDMCVKRNVVVGIIL